MYVVLHDAEKFGDTPIMPKIEILLQEYISHRQLILFGHNLERYIKFELEKMKHKPEYSGTYM